MKFQSFFPPTYTIQLKVIKENYSLRVFFFCFLAVKLKYSFERHEGTFSQLAHVNSYCKLLCETQGRDKVYVRMMWDLLINFQVTSCWGVDEEEDEVVSGL